MAKRKRSAGYMVNFMKKYRAAEQVILHTVPDLDTSDSDTLDCYKASDDDNVTCVSDTSRSTSSAVARDVVSSYSDDGMNDDTDENDGTNDRTNQNDGTNDDTDQNNGTNDNTDENDCIGDDADDDFRQVISSDDSDAEMVPISDFLSAVGKWAVQYRLPRDCINELLNLLRNCGRFYPGDIPKDARTVLKTPRSVEHSERCGGQYIYFGLQRFIVNHVFLNGLALLGNNNHLSMDVNIDGLPVKSSSKLEFWPILGRVIEFKGQPFPIALYSGVKKPVDVNDFLDDFVLEIMQMSTEGISINDRTITVDVRAFICDAPARATIKGTVGHNSKHACERCTVVGTSVERRTVFLNQDGEQRTDEGFRTDLYPHHKTSNTRLLKLPHINMIKSFVLDPMHLVFLGACRKYLSFLKSGPRTVRLGHVSLDILSRKLGEISSCTPSDFVRRPRSIQDLERWKATEFRQFTLYTGIIVLKQVVSNDLYTLFLAFSVAMRILHLNDSEKRNKLLGFARALLAAFVQNSSALLGQIFVTFNIHSLLHIADDVEYFNSSLTDISCFPYENYLFQLKLSVHGAHGNPIVSAAKRLEENYEHDVSRQTAKSLKVSISRRDRFFLSTAGHYCEVVAIENSEKLSCLQFKLQHLKAWFEQPIDSRQLGIVVCENVARCKRKNIELKPTDIAQKLYAINYLVNGLILIPVLSGTE